MPVPTPTPPPDGMTPAPQDTWSLFSPLPSLLQQQRRKAEGKAKHTSLTHVPSGGPGFTELRGPPRVTEVLVKVTKSCEWLSFPPTASSLVRHPWTCPGEEHGEIWVPDGMGKGVRDAGGPQEKSRTGLTSATFTRQMLVVGGKRSCVVSGPFIPGELL